MSDNSEDYSGCFVIIAIICGGLGLMLAIGEGCKAFQKELKRHPGDTIGGLLAIAAIATIVYFLVRKKK